MTVWTPLVIILLFTGAALAGRQARRHDGHGRPHPAPPAPGTPPPAATGGQVPGPRPQPKAPGHDHGGVDYDHISYDPGGCVTVVQRRFTDGCWHIHDADGQLLLANYGDAYVLDRMARELEDQP